MKEDNTQSKFSIWKYAGMATQFLVGLGLGVFIGMKIDARLHFKTPVLVWVLPLLIITGVIIKIVRDTSKLR
jgi:membrane protein DedA with SNARE-associated domain